MTDLTGPGTGHTVSTVKKRLLRLQFVLVLLVSAGLSPCLGDVPDAAPCPMAGCEKPTSAQFDCCCKVGDTDDSDSGILIQRTGPTGPAVAPASAWTIVLLHHPDGTTGAEEVAETGSGIPLHILHSSFLN